MVPDITRKEWKDLIEEKINPKVSSFSLQMKINSLQRSYKMELISLDDAVKDLYELCVKYEKIYFSDLGKIFKI